MQDWTGCSDLEQDDGSNGDRISITLTDKRDGNEYTVAKLKDGNCWMTENLKLQNFTLKSEDSDVDSDFYLPKSGYNIFPGTINQALVYVNEKGGYYTWFAATASDGTSQLSSQTNKDAQHSICPRGWKLPNFSTYLNLSYTYNYNAGNSMMHSPANFIIAGGCWTTGLIRACNGSDGCYGTYWSSTARSNEIARELFVWENSSTKSSEEGSSYDSIGYGAHVRCIFR